jgi:hypothetical protein
MIVNFLFFSIYKTKLKNFYFVIFNEQFQSLFTYSETIPLSFLLVYIIMNFLYIRKFSS